MSAIVSSEASSLLKPDPPLDIQPSKDKDTEQTSSSSNIEAADKSEILNYEHDEDEDDEDELEALRLAALQSRKPKKPEQPAYTLKQHPSRNNLTQIVLSGPQTPGNKSKSSNQAVALPDTSKPPPGYTPLSIPPLPLHGSAYVVGQVPSVPSTLTIPPLHHPHHINPQNPPQIPHHELVDYYDYGRDKSKYLSTHHEYRDRSPEFRNRERHRSPYERDRYYKDKFYNRSSSPGYVYRGSPGKERDTISARRTSRDYNQPFDTHDRTNKFTRYNSDSDHDLESSEEEVEEEVEVTATESEEEEEKVENKNNPSNAIKSTETGAKDNIDDKPKSKDKQMTEADDVLNVDCTEEIDEFTSFLNEFEDELKEKPKKDKLAVASTTKSKDNQDSSDCVNKRKKTKIIKRIVKRPKRTEKYKRNISSNKQSNEPRTYDGDKHFESGLPMEKRWSPKRYSRSPYRGDRYSQKNYSSNSHIDENRRRRHRTPSLSPEPQDKRLRFDRRKENSNEVSPNKKNGDDASENVSDVKSKSLPPSRALANNRRSNSRGAISQSRDVDIKNDDNDKRMKETVEEKEEREFQEKLNRAATQEERDRLVARRQKFQNVQPIGLTKKVISLKSKLDDKKSEETLKENQSSAKARKPIISRLSSETGDAISLDVDDTLDMFEEDTDKVQSSKSKGNVIDLREQLSKRRLQGVQKETTLKRDVRNKLKKPLGKSLGNIENTCSDSEDDNLDPLERATVDDVSPRTLRQIPDRFEDGIIKGKSRLVLRDGSRLGSRKVEAFTTEENEIINESFQEYSDEENFNNQKHVGAKQASRISVMKRLGKPVHREKNRENHSDNYGADYQKSDDVSDLSNGNKGNEDLTAHLPQSPDIDLTNVKKSKREKREKKDKKEKKKLKELRKLEKKLKKLKAKKRHKSSEKYSSEDSETDSYDDRIEYFMSDDEKASSKTHERKKSKAVKASKSSVNSRTDTNDSKKNYVKEEDSDDELFAFFEKDDGDASTKTTSVSDKKTDSKAKSKSQVATKVLVSSASDIKTKKDSSKLKVGSSNDSNLLSKMKKKNDKTLKRMKEIEEDRLIHR